LPRIFAPLATPIDGSSSVLESRTFRLRRLCVSEFPRCLHPPAPPAVKLRVAPKLRSSSLAVTWPRVSSNPASTAGSIMTSRPDSNFASSGKPADESSRLIGTCTPPPNSGCNLNFNPVSTAGCPAVYRRIQFNSASSCPAGTAFPIPLQGYQLLRSLGRIKLWKQVQKSDEFVDITSYGATIDY